MRFLLFMALVLSSGFAMADNEGHQSSTLPGNLPGNLIDDLIRKNGGEVPAKTAESALPTRREEVKKEMAKESPKDSAKEAKSAEASEPIFANGGEAKVSKAAPNSLWGRMTLSLVLALGLFAACAFAFKKWPGAKKINTRSRMIEVLSQHHLGPRRSLAVVRVSGETALIGITDHNITLLKSLSLLDDDLPQETREAKFALKKDEDKKFQNALGIKLSSGPNVREDAREEEFSMQGLKDFIGDRLKNMKEIS